MNPVDKKNESRQKKLIPSKKKNPVKKNEYRKKKKKYCHEKKYMIRRTAVSGNFVSRYHGGPIHGPTETPQYKYTNFFLIFLIQIKFGL